MVANFSVNIQFNDSYFKKLGLNKKHGFEDALDIAIDHATHDAENICRREAPIDTGNLRRSIHKRKQGKCQGELHARGAPYWVYLQYGTSKMDANPFVTRTARRVKPKVSAYVIEELKNAGILE
ncbi:HK97-gp10 family putative phage morphogenesis protein [Methanobrevibacter sp.]